MAHDHYEVYAVRYGHHARRSPENFLGGDSHDVDMPLDYFVWAIVGADRTFVLDTGFDATMARQRGRDLVRPVEDGLSVLGIDHARVSDVIISHMHYDHCGNHDLFPEATFHLQDAEMAYATGRCMCHAVVRAAFDAGDVKAMVGRVFRGRVAFHEGTQTLAPGLSVHHVGGHTRGLQVARVKTRRGHVVLGSDAAHFYANLERERPFPVLDTVAGVLEGYRTMRRLASSEAHIVPGHDPLVLTRYPAVREDAPDIVRLDVDPTA
jgi:glyoxylase-like metal-dependent hydrolase (beta-lactamase superfamily II)